MHPLQEPTSLLQKGIVALLEIKDSDIRLASLYQCRHAVDKAIHVGGAFSATIPMVSLYYGGIIDLDVEQPTAPGQDIFVLSKGHAVATLASIYADLGYFDRSVLDNSRSLHSILNGHPGPLLPGVHLATGPMGQGIGVAQGLAIAGQRDPGFDVYTITGDGELQEGPVWEAIMYAGSQGLENLCVMVDHNGGQLDNPAQLHFPYHDLGDAFRSFGWQVDEVDATRMSSMYEAHLDFKFGSRGGQPRAIICHSTKGHGGFSSFMNSHKATIPAATLDQEEELQRARRAGRVEGFFRIYDALEGSELEESMAEALVEEAGRMGLRLSNGGSADRAVEPAESSARSDQAAVRNKQIRYDSAALPKLDVGTSYAVDKVVEGAMKVFARDERVVSIDSDLASTSGLQAGVAFVDKARALNVGVAEANMLLIGEAFGILGYNTWVSTFCPFYDWKVLRRIAVGHQERLEVIEADGWLSEGHGIDLTLLATAADLETQSNGATHMGNDDALMMNEAAHVSVINVSCPRQLLSVMKWVMRGSRGILYIRVLRAPAPVLYDEDYEFEFGRAYPVRSPDAPRATILTSGRCLFEAVAAADQLAEAGTPIEVIDMPSIDADAILAAYDSGRPVVIAEQNNGYIWANVRRILFEKRDSIETGRLHPINTTGGRAPHYIHSGTYAELSAHYDLDAKHLARRVEEILSSAS